MGARSVLTRLAIVPLALGSTAMTCGPNVPTTDTCSTPAPSGAIDSIELGNGDPQSLFTPWHDGDIVPIVIGP